jgi:hypothetical protein
VCAGWAQKYQVGIEVDYEGIATQNGGWGVSWDGVSTVMDELQNLGLFIETLKSLMPEGHPVSLDVFADQGGGPGLTWIMNRYVPGMPTSERPWITSGVPTTFKVAALDYVNIMVGTTNAPATVKGYIDNYVGPNAQVASKSTPMHINAGLSGEYATVGLKAGDACEGGPAVPAVLEYASKMAGGPMRGAMFWAVAPYGCCPGCWISPLHISYWNCSYDATCPGLTNMQIN